MCLDFISENRWKSLRKKKVCLVPQSPAEHTWGARRQVSRCCPAREGPWLRGLEVTVMQPCSDVIFHCGDAEIGRAHLCRVSVAFSVSGQPDRYKEKQWPRQAKAFALTLSIRNIHVFPPLTSTLVNSRPKDHQQLDLKVLDATSSFTFSLS